MVSLGLAWKRLTLAEKGYHFSVLLWISIVSITPTTLVFWDSYVAIQVSSESPTCNLLVISFD